VNPSAVLLLVPLTLAVRPVQDPAPTPDRPTDPTAIDAELMRALARPDAARAGGMPAALAPFPSVAIRGVVLPRGGDPLAVLEIDSARVRVKVGTVVPFAGGDSLRVERIVADEIVLSRASTGESRAVR